MFLFKCIFSMFMSGVVLDDEMPSRDFSSSKTYFKHLIAMPPNPPASAIPPFLIQRISYLYTRPFMPSGGITLETYSEEVSPSPKSSVWRNPAHPFTIAANVVWLLAFGWAFFIMHLAAAIIQFLTIIGAGTGLNQLKLAAFVL